MIPRYQRVLFWSLVGAIILMGLVLIHSRRQAGQRLGSLNNSVPLGAPTATDTVDVIFYMASDTDASITPAHAQTALPKDASARARALLDQLMALYAQPDSAHPLDNADAGPAVDDVYFMNADSVAIINLHGAFADNHPSGIEAEQLTLLSMLKTLHGAFPRVSEVRFLVDGQPRDTLAGHADLARAYPVADITSPTKEAQP
ncbi:MAG: GerMN domain-containing protein [Acidobacteriaceae bacterium]|nr:GerMN domain-containing protein [Acidobacteriaceae bacterium]